MDMMKGTTLQLAASYEPTALQSWAWAVALMLAGVAAALLYWVRRKQGSGFGALARRGGVRRLGSTRLSSKVTLEVVEFEAQRILLAVSDHGVREIVRVQDTPEAASGRNPS
jgi:hypothetical protein